MIDETKLNIDNFTLKKGLLTVLKGTVIGFVSLAIPGLSAGTFAIILGTYYLMIESLSGIFKHFFKSLRFLFFLMLGFGLGALIGAFSMNALYETYPLLVVFAVFGSIIGSAIPQMKKLSPYTKNPVNWIIFAAVIAVVFFNMLIYIKGENITLDPDMTVGDYIKLGLVGLVTSMTTIMPGLDFAVVCISLGYYYSLLGALTDLVTFTNFFHNLIVLLVYLAGNVTGMILFSKAVKKLVVKRPVQVEFATAGFVVSAPFVVFRDCIIDNDRFVFSPYQLVGGIFLGLFCFVLVLCVYDLGIKKQNDPRPSGRKKRNMLRFGYTIFGHIPLVIAYSIRLKKYIKDEKLSFEEKYAKSVKIILNINKYGRISPIVYGKENLVREKGVLIVSNHQGKYDGLAVFTALSDYPCSILADKTMASQPLYSSFAKIIGAKLIDKKDPRQAIRQVNMMAEDIKKGISHILFPEGDWGDNKNNLQDFHTGGFSAAFKSKCDITPIVLYDTYKVYSISSLKKIYPEIHILPAIRYEEYKDMNKNQLSDMLKSIMQKKLDEISFNHKKEEGLTHAELLQRY